MEIINFYGRTSNPKYWPFSNFYEASFRDHADTLWTTTEHYFQAMKFLPGDIIMYPKTHPDGKYREVPLREHILIQPTAALAAKEGRRKDLPLRKDWDEPSPIMPGFLTKDVYMYRALQYKFTQHATLKQLLIDTGDAIIVEDSKIDSYWGCGADRQGKNMLGQLLMKLREQFKQDTSID